MASRAEERKKSSKRNKDFEQAAFKDRVDTLRTHVTEAANLCPIPSLPSSEEHNDLSMILQNIDYGVMFMGPDLRARLINPAFRKMWSIEDCFADNNPDFFEMIEYLRGQKIYDVAEEKWEDYVTERYEALLTADGKERESRRADGVVLSYKCLPMPDGGRMLTYNDITKRKTAENMKNEFVSTVSHELRTPLTSIMGSLGLVRSGTVGSLPEKVSSMIDIAYKNSNRLIRLINDILDMEKIEAGKMDFKMEILDLIKLVQEAVEANKGYGEEHNVSFQLTTEHMTAQVEGDQDRLLQVMSNLMSNAAKFSPPGGTVEITVVAKEARFRVAVSDRGQGIPHAFRDRIFGKFSQADSTDSRQAGGTGLGLNISQAIVEHHDGTIGFDSEVGKGTTFYFDLPKRTEDKTGTIPRDKPSTAYHILICEDEPDISKLLQLMLMQDGFTTEIAHTAAKAKNLLNAGRFDAMTLDLDLPDQDGISLLRELREAPNTRDLPIIVVSAKASEGEKQINGDAVGVIDWLEKPIDQARLSDKLWHSLEGLSKGKARILHVEDDPDILRVVSALVEEFAVSVPALNLAEARPLLKNQQFDLVILDLLLPDGGGEELLPLLNSGNHHSTPVVIFSAMDAHQEMAERINGVLVKSKTNNESLLQTIRSSIDSSSQISK